MLLTYGVGLGYGLRHAFESDHVAAVTNIVVQGRGAHRAAFIGAFWGLGHGVAVVLGGAVLLALDVTVPRRTAVGLELGVVAMLLFLGIRSLLPRHDETPGRATRSPLQAGVVGLLHGAAGSSALVLLMLTLAPSRAHAAVFLCTFAVGATFSMTLLSGLLAVPLGAAVGRFPRLASQLRALAGALSIAAAAVLLFALTRSG